MLGENHSLINEFPAYKESIIAKNGANALFAKDAKRYHLLDNEIRKLELRNAPIEDDTFHQMKIDRAALKDSLYHRISG